MKSTATLLRECFPSEAALCAAFLATVPATWTAYAETAGWDLLLVHNLTGEQVGVQAKLVCNPKVILQAVEGRWDRKGPDYRAVLVPSSGALGELAEYIGVAVMTPGDLRATWFGPALPGDDLCIERRWHNWCPDKRHALPAYVPDVAAGASGPVQLTDWKIRAMRIAITLELRGYVTRDDFRRHGIDHRRWFTTGGGWLARDEHGRFVRGPSFPDFQAQHPRVYMEIKAESDTWMQEAK